MNTTNNFIFLLLICFSLNSNAQTVIEKVSKDYSITDWKSFENRIKSDLTNVKEKGIVLFKPDSSYLITGYGPPVVEFYDWDLYFENIYMSYFGISDYCFSNLKSFLRRQLIYGFIPRTLNEPRHHEHFKPFLAQVALIGSKQINEYTWFLEKTDGVEGTFTYNLSYYERLKKSIDFWFWYEDFDKNGLPVWNGNEHSFDGQISRSGELHEFKDEGVDLACYLYRELKSMQLISMKLGFDKDSKDYEMRSKNLADKINLIFWDEADQFYYDRNEITGKQIKVKSHAGFMPLFCGIVSKERAESLIKKHLLNKNEFWLNFPVSSYSKTEPDYTQTPVEGLEWEGRGPAWLPMNYMIFHALMDYGYQDFAKQLAMKTFEMAYQINSVTREYFNGDTGKGYGRNPFWGWTTLASFMPFEFELGYNPMIIDDKPMMKIGTDILGISFPK